MINKVTKLFPFHLGYSWRGYGSYSQLQDEVLKNVTIERQSLYRMVLRYINPNPTPIIGEVKMVSEDGTVTPAYLKLQPTPDGQPSFVAASVSENAVYPLPFDLTPGTVYILGQ